MRGVRVQDERGEGDEMFDIMFLFFHCHGRFYGYWGW